MTCLEKLKDDHPNYTERDIETIIKTYCPYDSTFGYAYIPWSPHDCDSIDCKECWNREVSKICEFYQTKDGRCNNTRGIEKCKCYGYKVNCDFFPGVREEAKGLNPSKLKDLVDEDNNELTADYYQNRREVAEAMEKAQRHSRTKVICISGKAQHGKDTTAGFLKEALESKGKKVLVTHYGDLVKYVCKTFFDWNGEKDEAGRTLLQYIGTDCIRTKTPDYWVDFVLSILKHFPDTWDYVLIPDCRFPNEIECVKNAGWDMLHIRVFRHGNGFVSPLTEEQQNHISETALDKTMPDFGVMNYGTLDDLKEYIYWFAGYLEGN